MAALEQVTQPLVVDETMVEEVLLVLLVVMVGTLHVVLAAAVVGAVPVPVLQALMV